MEDQFSPHSDEPASDAFGHTFGMATVHLSFSHEHDAGYASRLAAHLACSPKTLRDKRFRSPR